MAECIQFLVKQYGSIEKVAKVIGVSDSTIGIWTKIFNLPEEFQELIRQKKIYPVAAYYIASRISDPEQQLEIARLAASENWASQK